MKTEIIVWNEEVARGLVQTMLEDEVIDDFEIYVTSTGECKVTLWMIE
jgi:hypothetical protein